MGITLRHAALCNRRNAYDDFSLFLTYVIHRQRKWCLRGKAMALVKSDGFGEKRRLCMKVAILRTQRGQAGRDAMWEHPDLLPAPDDLADPLGFVVDSSEGLSGD